MDNHLLERYERPVLDRAQFHILAGTKAEWCTAMAVLAGGRTPLRSKIDTMINAAVTQRRTVLSRGATARLGRSDAPTSPSRLPIAEAYGHA